MAGFQIDDAEAAHADARATIGVESVVVGAARRHGAAHFTQGCSVYPLITTEFKNARDAAHQCFSAYVDVGCEIGDEQFRLLVNSSNAGVVENRSGSELRIPSRLRHSKN